MKLFFLCLVCMIWLSPVGSETLWGTEIVTDSGDSEQPSPVISAPIVNSATFSRTVTRTVGYPFLERLPQGYEELSERRWPLILFLHGAGERRGPLTDLEGLGPFVYAQKHPEFPFVIIAPQCPMNQDWDPISLSALLDHVLEKRHIAPDRVYLTGFSMGGAGTWETAMDYPDRFAAIAPLCGRAIPLLAGRLWHVPVWVFHGEKDEVVPPSQSIDMVRVLRGMGHFETRFTLYPELGHEIWSRTYDNPELYEWFLSYP